MKNNIALKLLSSLPVILIMLYFMPFLGICLIILRYFIYDKKKRISTPIYIFICGILILIPKGLDLIFETAKIDINNIPYLNDIINSELYNVDFMKFSKRLIYVGIIFLIISCILKTIFDKVSNKLNSGFRNYIRETEKRDYEISKRNDMEIKMKQEKARNTSYVKCPNCGSDNLLSDKFGKCKYCRRDLVNKDYKD